MSETLKLPEKTRIAMGELYKQQQAAVEKFQLAMGVALDFLELDPNLNHQINFDSGIVTPAIPPTPLTAVENPPSEATG